MKKQGRLVLILVLALIVVIFAVLNVNPVAINFGFAQVDWPLIIILIVTLLIGALITFLVSTGTSYGQRKAHKRMTKELDDLKATQTAQIDSAVKQAQVEAAAELDKQLKTKDEQITELQNKINQLTQQQSN